MIVLDRGTGLECTAAVETEAETAKASGHCCNSSGSEATARAAKADEAATGDRRNPAVRFPHVYRKEDLLSIAGELGLHCNKGIRKRSPQRLPQRFLNRRL